MKKITLSLFAAVASCTSMFSQVVLQENFTSPFNAVASGWNMSNNSSNLGTNPNWVQGTSAVFPAYNGGANDFFASNFNAVGTGDISNWLFTPVVTIQDGAVLQFATRSAAVVAADRLQVRFSTSTSTTIPAGPTSLGTYTNIMLDINPQYSLGTNSTVVNGSVNGYPGSWVVYTLQVTGVPTAITGRFAFRYFVENGGPNGANSNYVGIDGVRYTLPCAPTVASFTTCANINTTLTAVGLPATTYSWSNGSTGPSIVVNPPATTVYTLYPIANGVPCPNPVTATITTTNQMAVSIVASSTNVCDGSSATLTAVAPANTFLWNTNQTTAVITVTPTGPGLVTYSVGATAGAFPNICAGGNTININVLPTPTINVSTLYTGSTPTLGGCPGTDFTITAGGANIYNFIIEGQVFSTNPLALSFNSLAAAGTQTYIILGQGANGCIDGGIASFSVHPQPTVSIIASPSVVCVNKTLTLTASGAASYTWANTSTLTANPYTVNTGVTAGPKVYVVVGKNAGGCTATAQRTVSVNACTGIENVFGDVSLISTFPNPFSNELKVSGFNGRLEIFNALGQVVYATTVNESETINTTEFAKGVYILKAYGTQGEEIKMTKLVKN